MTVITVILSDKTAFCVLMI